MKIATFNTNSVRVRIPIIMEWLEKEKPDILCLQETKVQDKDFPIDDFEATGYHSLFRGQKSYNGVAIISKQPLTEITTDLYERGDEQARFISAKLSDIPVINSYVPQGYAPGTEKFEYKLSWLKKLLSHIKEKYNPNDSLIVLGDFNVALESIDLFDPEGFRGSAGFHEDEQKILQSYLDWGLRDLFREYYPEEIKYTFWDYRIPNGFKRNMGWRIDYIFTTEPLSQKLKNIWIDSEPRSHVKPSDHTFLVAEFDIN